jgi:glycosyltransferase involved in cell wall biosynthesis
MKIPAPLSGATRLLKSRQVLLKQKNESLRADSSEQAYEVVKQLKLAIMIPCYNEEMTIGKVIDDFRTELPSAELVIFDNGSSDKTARVAIEHGARVLKEGRKGKGFVVESMFDRVDADVYVMVDGDDTYPAEYVRKLVSPVITENADMTVGARLSLHTSDSFRPFHFFGNKLVAFLVNWITGSDLKDIMSGYRAFNRRIAKQIPVVSSGFEVETEMTLQALYYRLKVVEIEIPYRERPTGSESKLRTFHDGMRVLWKIFTLFRAFKPLAFFGTVGLLCLVAGLAAGIPPIHDYVTDPNHFVRHVPLAILATGLVVLSAGCFFLGILLHSLNWRLKEMHNVLTRNR